MKNIWRQDFPQIRENEAYLDTAAMSLKPNNVIEAVDHYYRDLSVNIHRGMYRAGLLASDLYEKAREKTALFINALPEEIVFTRGTTSALNLVALSYGSSKLQKGDEIVTSELEHHSSFLPWQQLALRIGARIRFVPLDSSGRITVANFKSVLTAKTKVVALTYVSNVMGYETPIKEIIASAHERGVVVVVDAAQAVGHLKIDVRDLGADFLAFSGHKMLAPTGIGVLYGKKEFLDAMEPLEYGGDMNDEVGKDLSTWKEAPTRFEAGTMPVAAAIGLTEAIEYLEKVGLENIHRESIQLYKYTMAQLKKIEGVTIYNPDADMGIIAFNIEDVPAHDAVSFYADNGVALRAGHHCAMLVTKWLGISSCLRASFFLYNNYEDADLLIRTTKEAVKFFRTLGF